jgi:hypothetical protein
MLDAPSNPPCPPFRKVGNLPDAVFDAFLPFAKGGQEGFLGDEIPAIRQPNPRREARG